jgi:hypothetical protein
MFTKLKKRWLRPRVLGILAAKLILAGATDLAALTAPPQKVEFSTVNSFTAIHQTLRSER